MIIFFFNHYQLNEYWYASFLVPKGTKILQYYALLNMMNSSRTCVLDKMPCNKTRITESTSETLLRNDSVQITDPYHQQ